jgi:hypothetical protein
VTPDRRGLTPPLGLRVTLFSSRVTLFGRHVTLRVTAPVTPCLDNRRMNTGRMRDLRP